MQIVLFDGPEDRHRTGGLRADAAAAAREVESLVQVVEPLRRIGLKEERELWRPKNWDG